MTINEISKKKNFGGDDLMLELRLCRQNDFKYRGFSYVKNEFVSGNLIRFPEVYLSIAIEGFFKKGNGEEILTYLMVCNDSVERCIGKDKFGNEIYKKVSEEELWLN